MQLETQMKRTGPNPHNTQPINQNYGIFWTTFSNICCKKAFRHSDFFMVLHWNETFLDSSRKNFSILIGNLWQFSRVEYIPRWVGFFRGNIHTHTIFSLCWCFGGVLSCSWWLSYILTFLWRSSILTKIGKDSWRTLEIWQIYKIFKDLQTQFNMGRE